MSLVLSGFLSCFLDPKQEKQPMSGSCDCLLKASGPGLILPTYLAASDPEEANVGFFASSPLFPALLHYPPHYNALRLSISPPYQSHDNFAFPPACQPARLFPFVAVSNLPPAPSLSLPLPRTLLVRTITTSAIRFPSPSICTVSSPSSPDNTRVQASYPSSRQSMPDAMTPLSWWHVGRPRTA